MAKRGVRVVPAMTWTVLSTESHQNQDRPENFLS